MWLVDQGYGETVEGVSQARYDETEDLKVIKKIEVCGEKLTNWSRNNFGNIRNELIKKRKNLAWAEQQAVRTGNSSRVIHLKKEINSLMGKEERMWRQRARVTYIREGDQNTCFFHSHATQRKRRNSIKKIRNHENVMCSDQEQIVAIFVEFYQQLFTSSNPEVTTADLDSIPKIVIGEMNDILMGEFQEWEVKAALNQMAPLKALRPDRMPPQFYQNFWQLVKVMLLKPFCIF